MSAVTRLLGSPEGMAAVKLLAPLAEELAEYIAGRRDEPPELPEIPHLKSEIALERARLRAHHGGDGG